MEAPGLSVPCSYRALAPAGHAGSVFSDRELSHAFDKAWVSAKRTVNDARLRRTQHDTLAQSCTVHDVLPVVTSARDNREDARQGRSPSTSGAAATSRDWARKADNRGSSGVANMGTRSGADCAGSTAGCDMPCVCVL